jgi:ribosomal protein S17E
MIKYGPTFKEETNENSRTSNFGFNKQSKKVRNHVFSKGRVGTISERAQPSTTHTHVNNHKCFITSDLLHIHIYIKQLLEDNARYGYKSYRRQYSKFIL